MDRYILGQSKSCTLNEQHCECRLDVCLKDNELYNHSTIYGYVRNFCCTPISNALIKIYNKCNQLIGKTYSLADGSYVFYGIKKFSYIKIIVSKTNYENYNSGLIKVCSLYFKYNINLKKNYCIDRKKVISGHVIDCNAQAIIKIPVELYKYYCNCSKNLYKSTLTNEYGQFIFSGDFFGKYEINIVHKKYEPAKEVIFIKNCNRIINMNFTLYPNKKTKIYGDIIDKNGNCIPYADVVLYRVDEDNKLSAIDFCNCDQYGKYLFDNLPFYKYVVKAKADSN